MSPLKERSEILQEARNIGGRRLVLICEEIMDRSTVPIDETLALKFRNVGVNTVKLLRQLGLVTMDTKDGNTILLSNRAWMALINLGIQQDSTEQIRQKITTGQVNWKRIRNCGRRTRNEIFRWVGLPEQTTRPRKPCPHCGRLA